MCKALMHQPSMAVADLCPERCLVETKPMQQLNLQSNIWLHWLAGSWLRNQVSMSWLRYMDGSLKKDDGLGLHTNSAQQRLTVGLCVS